MQLLVRIPYEKYDLLDVVTRFLTWFVAGDTIHFIFMSQNHTVTQSSFDTPCNKLADGKDSGFMPNQNNTVSPPPAWDFVVPVTTPLWFYCKQRSGNQYVYIYISLFGRRKS